MVKSKPTSKKRSKRSSSAAVAPSFAKAAKPAKASKSDGGFTASELRTLRSLKDPAGIQRFISDMPYHLATSAWSPRVVLRERSAHCLEGALFAAAALRVNGYPPLIVDLEAEEDTDHVIAVFQQDGGWGAIGASNYATCRFRAPVYRTLRELALSYFDGYFNLRRERTLRRFSRPVHMKRFDKQSWMTTEEPLWFVVDHLFDVPHEELLTPRMRRRKMWRVDQRSFEAGKYGHRL